MRARTCLLSLPLCVFVLAAGCSELPVASMPERFPRLSTAASYGNVWVEGRFYTNHEDIFGQNLLDAGIVPVAVRIFLRQPGTTDANSRVFMEDIQPQLYLPDGAVLKLVPYDRIEIDRYTEDRITEEALDINVIKSEEQSEEGFIFFKLPPQEFRVRGVDSLVHLKEPLSQEVRISESMIALEYFTDAGARPIYVGLRKDRRPDRG